MTPAGAFDFTAGQVAALLGAELVGNPDAAVRTVAPVTPGADGALTFIRSPKYAGKWAGSACTTALVSRGIEIPDHDPDRRALIIVDDADMAVIQILRQVTPPLHAPGPGVHPTAVVDPAADIASDAQLGAFCVVGPGARVGAGSVLHPHVILGAHAVVGTNTALYSGVVVGDRCVVSDRCTLHSNVVIGGDGFGYYQPEPGADHIKVPHAGIVHLADDVEVGAGTCIDRAKFGATLIGRGVKIDNLCQIGHGVTIGERTLICAHCGIGGSTTIGKDVVLAGQVGVSDNLTIGEGSVVGAGSGVICSVPANENWLGYPARKHSITLQIWGTQTRMHKFMREQMARNAKANDSAQDNANIEANAQSNP
ncbi:MAG: UDP-3-O-acylglucosamine N-acyltransferase [Phycisphaeraceae bacterium]|nr:MAG: UDP-3-O-acylglucosamine N-acyltransferase [Phycisphaeraceae bacterium]